MTLATDSNLRQTSHDHFSDHRPRNATPSFQKLQQGNIFCRIGHVSHLYFLCLFLTDNCIEMVVRMEEIILGAALSATFIRILVGSPWCSITRPTSLDFR